MTVEHHGPGGHVSLTSSVATSCKPSHSSGLSTVVREVSKSFFISCDEMIRGDRLSAGNLNVVFEVGTDGDVREVEDRSAQRAS